MIGGLAVAWHVNVTLSPSRTERGSIDNKTVGASRKRKQLPIIYTKYIFFLTKIRLLQEYNYHSSVVEKNKGNTAILVVGQMNSM